MFSYNLFYSCFLPLQTSPVFSPNHYSTNFSLFLSLFKKQRNKTKANKHNKKLS